VVPSLPPIYHLYQACTYIPSIPSLHLYTIYTKPGPIYHLYQACRSYTVVPSLPPIYHLYQACTYIPSIPSLPPIYHLYQACTYIPSITSRLYTAVPSLPPIYHLYQACTYIPSITSLPFIHSGTKPAAYTQRYQACCLYTIFLAFGGDEVFFLISFRCRPSLPWTRQPAALTPVHVFGNIACQRAAINSFPPFELNLLGLLLAPATRHAQIRVL